MLQKKIHNMKIDLDRFPFHDEVQSKGRGKILCEIKKKMKAHLNRVIVIINYPYNTPSAWL